MDKSAVSTKLLALILVIFTGIAFTACGSSSDSSDLDGELSVEVIAPPGTSFSLSVSLWEGETFDGEAGTATVPESGEFSEIIGSGSFEGVMVAVSVFSEGNSDVLIRLLNDGDLVAETDTPSEDEIYEIEVGDLPDFDF